MSHTCPQDYRLFCCYSLKTNTIFAQYHKGHVLQLYRRKWEIWVTRKKLRNRLLSPYLPSERTIPWHKSRLLALSEESISLYYSFKYEAGGPSASKMILTSRTSRQPPGPGKSLKWRSLRSLCVVGKWLLFPGRLSTAFTPILPLIEPQRTGESSLSNKNAD